MVFLNLSLIFCQLSIVRVMYPGKDACLEQYIECNENKFFGCDFYQGRNSMILNEPLPPLNKVMLGINYEVLAKELF